LALAFVPLVLVVMNATYAGFAALALIVVATRRA
jgi:hypothetical protein